ncbi:MAG: Rieske 2Fe-2S domain-containing protein [Acidimicrobiaceae bacterium]|nr:Rieske 2Fe-2S domain-containing protein [Acidimicrobiaceae bacterium]
MTISPEELNHHSTGPVESKSAERVVAMSFLVSFLATVALGVTFWQGGQPQLEGTFLFVALVGIGVGTVSWGKYLVPQGPFVEEREELVSTEAEKAAFEASLGRGTSELTRRKALTRLLGLSLGALGLIQLFPFVRSLGPLPKNSLTLTNWKTNARLVKPDGTPISVNDLEVGGILTAFPEGFAGNAYDQVVLVRPSQSAIVTKPGRESWAPQGYLAYSKVCTHAGCPVGLYQQLTQQLLCPCHQSLFDVMTGATPVFGPAPRPLPQLPLLIDSNGFLRAQAGFDQPVGPGYWERS